VTYKEIKAGRSIFTNFWDQFWKWDDFCSYTLAVAWTGDAILLPTYVLIHEPLFIETLGTLALGTEACQGVPQLFKNFKRK
jgi:hypothetical protein